MKLDKIAPRFIVIDYAVYHVINYDEGIKKGFKKSVAYLIETDFINIVLPYKGVLKDIDPEKRTPGIYSSRKTTAHRFILPNKNVRAQYSPDNIQSTKDDIFSKGNFVKGDIIIDTDGEIFKPRIKPDDDLNLKVFKTAVNLKNISLSSYDNRFQAIDIGTNPSNRKSNAKKAILNNDSLSSNKLIQLADVMDLDVAVVIKDRPGSMFPMLTDGKPIIMYSNNAFQLNDAINIATLNLETLYEVPEE
jgi:hypothetical protein